MKLLQDIMAGADWKILQNMISIWILSSFTFGSISVRTALAFILASKYDLLDCEVYHFACFKEPAKAVIAIFIFGSPRDFLVILKKPAFFVPK